MIESDKMPDSVKITLPPLKEGADSPTDPIIHARYSVGDGEDAFYVAEGSMKPNGAYKFFGYAVALSQVHFPVPGVLWERDLLEGNWLGIKPCKFDASFKAGMRWSDYKNLIWPRRTSSSLISRRAVKASKIRK